MTDTFDLADLDDMSGYADTEVPEDNGSVPDGRYTAFVDQVELTKTKTGKRRLSWQMKIIGPNQVGRCVFNGHMLETADNLKWLKRDLKTCGIELSAWSELPQRLQDLLDIVLDIQVKTKGEFQNCYFKSRVELAEGTKPRDLIAEQDGSTVSGSDVAGLFDDDTPF